MKFKVIACIGQFKTIIHKGVVDLSEAETIRNRIAATLIPSPKIYIVQI